MILNELKNKFKHAGFFVDDKNNIVILKIEKFDDGYSISSVDLNHLAKVWDDIVKNREKNGWDEILKKLGL